MEKMREKLQRKLGKAFDNKLSQVVREFEGERIIDFVQEEYDPLASYDDNPVTKKLTGRAMFNSFDIREVGDPNISGSKLNILANDVRFFALANEIDFEPEVGDIIDGQTVMWVGQGALRSHFKALLRIV